MRVYVNSKAFREELQKKFLTPTMFAKKAHLSTATCCKYVKEDTPIGAKVRDKLLEFFGDKVLYVK